MVASTTLFCATPSLVERQEKEVDSHAQLLAPGDGIPINKQDVLNYNLYRAVQHNKNEKVAKALSDGANPDCYIFGKYPLSVVETAECVQLLIDAGANPLATGPYGSPLAVHIRNYIFNELLNDAEEFSIIRILASSSKVTRQHLEAIFERMERFKTFEKFQQIKSFLLGLKG